MNTPQFTHDCENCVFLGTHEDHDLYFCDQLGHPTIIARWGSDGPDYQSGMIFGEQRTIPHLAEAYDRAVARGLVQNPIAKPV